MEQNPIASYCRFLHVLRTTRLSIASSPPPSNRPRPIRKGIMIDQGPIAVILRMRTRRGKKQPSLGYLDQALQFIAAERAKLTCLEGQHPGTRKQFHLDDHLPRSLNDTTLHNHHHHQQQHQQQLTTRRVGVAGRKARLSSDRHRPRILGRCGDEQSVPHREGRAREILLF